MSFMNATLLFGSLAVLIPIALHLLGKREPQRVLFPAVRFLTQRLQTNRRRMQVKRWVLLALRVLTLALLALALAQPHVHRASLGDWLGVGSLGLLGLSLLGLSVWAVLAQRGAWLRWGLLLGSVVLLLASLGWGARTVAGSPSVVSALTAPSAVVFLLDNGPTSGYGQPSSNDDDTQDMDNQSRLDRAREAAVWLLARYPLESRFAVVDRSARPAAFALDQASIQRSLKASTPLQATRPLTERLDAAVRLLRTSDLPRRNLYIFTDLAKSSWTTDSGQQIWSALAAELANEPKVNVTVIDIGSPDYRNRSLTDVQLADATPPRNTPFSISALVTDQNGTVTEQNGARRDPTERVSSSGREVTVQARMFDTQPGLPLERDGAIEYPRLRTVDRKSIRIDGVAQRVDLTLPPLEYGTHHGYLEIIPSDDLSVDDVRYFTVNVQPPVRILIVCDDGPERRVLSAMLNPFGNDDARREYVIDFTTEKELSDYDLSNYAAIGLFNPRLPASLVRERLEGWVRSGGQLFASLGNALDFDGAGEPIAWPLLGSPKRIWRVSEPGTFSQLLQPSHPALNALANVPGGAPWSAFRVYNYWQLSDVEGFSELLRYAGTEHLALGERRFGDGRVMLLTTPLPAILPPASDWNDLLASSLTGAWDVYLILLRQIFEDLTGGLDSSLNFTIGEPVVLAQRGDQQSSYQLFAPSVPPVQLDVAQTNIVPGPALIIGNYWLRGAGNVLLGYSANLAAEATDLERVTNDVLDEAFGKDQYQIVKDKEDITLADGEGTQARTLYPLAMLLVAAVFALEQLLANRFYPPGNSDPSSARSKHAKPGGKQAVAAA